MTLRRTKKVKLAQTLEGLNSQADNFLKSQGFESTETNKKLFAAFIQHMPQDQDSFDPNLVGRMMRKAKANELAFYIMHPDKAPKSEQQDGSETIQKVTAEVV